MHRRAVERMTRMILELLDFTRNRPGSAIPLNRQPADLEVIARATVNEIGLSLADNRIHLEVNGSSRAELDSDRIAQLLGNLVGNALEHGSERSPITVRLSGESDHIELRVVSHGPAIPATLLPSLFHAFRQGRKPKATSSSVGLGLHIVDLIARAHGGTVELQSSGDETAFCVILPVSALAPRLVLRERRRWRSSPFAPLLAAATRPSCPET
jgi:signal transduction histidine kinase